jgi:hypothetical protein
LPYTKPTGMIIIKSDGTPTGLMPQDRVESYLSNLLNANRIANLKQALNQSFDGNAKPTGNYQDNARAIWHASSGNGQKSVSLFFFMNGSTANLVAMGEHVAGPGTKYDLCDYGQPTGEFTKNARITL